MTPEHKALQIKADDVTEDGVIKGYASLFGVKDQGGDTIQKGAYRKSLKGVETKKMLWQHDPSKPIGVWNMLAEDAKGLAVEGQINQDVNQGAEALSLLRQGAVEGLSIGYRTIKAKADGNGRLLQEVDLWEVSIVTFPMQSEATVDSVKSVENALKDLDEGDTAQVKRIVETALRDAGFSAWRAKAIAAKAPQSLLGNGSRDATPAEKAKMLVDGITF